MKKHTGDGSRDTHIGRSNYLYRKELFLDLSRVSRECHALNSLYNKQLRAVRDNRDTLFGHFENASVHSNLRFWSKTRHEGFSFV